MQAVKKKGIRPLSWEKDPSSDQIILRGCLDIVIKNAFNGKIVGKRRIENTIVTSGRRWVLEAIQSGNAASAEVISNLAVGTATVAPVTGDTALNTENARKVVGTWDSTNLTSNPPSWQAQTSFATDEANTTLGEVGLFNSSAGGTMLGRVTFTQIDKTTSNTLSVSYTISN